MSGYIRTDFSYWRKHSIFLIPTIEISKWAKGIEISLLFLWFNLYAIISYIKEEDYEP